MSFFGEDDGLSFQYEELGDVEVSLEQEPRAGWSVYTGCEGDCPEFVAFFLRIEDADRFLDSIDEAGSTIRHGGSGQAVPAVLVGNRVSLSGLFDTSAPDDGSAIATLIRRLNLELRSEAWGSR